MSLHLLLALHQVVRGRPTGGQQVDRKVGGSWRK